ncbi:hypothetical protein [Streptomyces johnsoniae]|uniref:Uncharacterized protein n=1 Tax=Streptomyces johnsoniae TaxID=3075532 RepID=A0ABU2S8F5_9ACTN|nr:hypothetical protein [Streptomyces sp. DSM 41886]MDT0444694.1 hypothetical protein [Streptomyces sp. DSM 41886]
MTTATTSVRSTPSRRWDRIGRGLMALNSAITFAVFVNGFFLMADASDDRLMVEGWRTFGYFVFSAMWAMLAFRPRQVPAIWELVIFHKVAATVLALTILHTDEGMQASISDSWVASSTILAYGVCRGWESWRVLRLGNASANALRVMNEPSDRERHAGQPAATTVRLGTWSLHGKRRANR